MIKDITDRRNVYFIGDLHGDWKALKFFLDQVSFNYRDILISVGDLIDRGNNSLEVLSFFLYTPNAYAVLGNHEDMAIRGLVHGDAQWGGCWMQNGGIWSLDYPIDMITGLMRKVEDTFPLAMTFRHENTKFGVTHAECPTEHWEDYVSQAGKYHPWDKDAIWGRRCIKGGRFTQIKGVNWTIHGHSVRNEVTTIGNQKWIDTGSVFDVGTGKYALTILEWDTDTKEFVTHRIERDCFEPKGLKHRIV